MADKDRRRVENAAGIYFTDDSCISCAACWKEAPNNFASHPVHTFAYVVKQPQNHLEKEACDRAMKMCPVNAIGSICD